MQTNPPPRKAYKGMAMEGAIARWYAKTTLKDLKRHKLMAAELVNRIPPGGRVLEIAPGPGYFCIELAKLANFDITGPAVSMLPGMTFSVAEASLGPGDVLLFFTDGVTEARDPAGALFGDDRLLAALPADAKASTEVKAVEAALSAFSSGADPADDITMICASRT